MATIIKAVALLRSANTNQAHQNTALLNQYECVEKYAQKHKLEIKTVIDNEQIYEGQIKTASKLMREVYNFCKSNPDVKHILVTDPTRISRDYDEYSNWKTFFKAIGVSIVTVNTSRQPVDSPTEQFMANLMEVMSQYDTARRSEAVRRGLQRKKVQEAKN
jgi:DNA invertase Pin-like site-specific DNA recombinase